MRAWHTLDGLDAVRELNTDVQRGLSSDEAARRLASYGPNALVERGRKGPWRILREQLTATLVVLLLVAAAISLVLGDYKDAGAILAIVGLNTLLGFIQEYRAERAMAALKRLAVPLVRVRRDGHVRLISAHELVPGDIVLLEAGSLVPADCRILEAVNLRTQEAALTGESEPVEKDPAPLPVAEIPLGDRRNMAYMGTAVTYGRGVAVVVATGMRTELGRIAELLQQVEHEPTPLQRRLDRLGRQLAGVALGIVAVIVAAGLLRGEELRLMFLTAVSLAVAAVPEGLPAVVTITLALGAQRMLRRRALIRKLPAVETLGSVTVICTDKTGTLTENRMTVSVLELPDRRVELVGSDALAPAPDWQPAVALVLAGGALCSDAVLEPGSGAPFQVIGDPTEGAVVIAAARFGLAKPALEARLPRVAELPFDPVRKRMTTVHAVDAAPSAQGGHAADRSADWLEELRRAFPEMRAVAFTKGAVEGLLTVCSHVWVDGRPVPLDAAWRGRLVQAHDRLAQVGMRVLGLAFKPLAAVPEEPSGSESHAFEQELIFAGMVGMIDPPRPEAKPAVRRCREAGIRPVMVTGDHPLTAQQIARQLGIATDGRILTGQELDRLSAADLERIVEEVPVFARVSPEHKLLIVQALQARGHIVAMTGDGVNDAPALKKADVGVAMGITGTDVAKEAADMVLLDDNFATIVAAVEEGRIIYDNIRKFIRYLLTTNSAEIWVMLLGPLLGLPLPLLPLQILWMNLVTDGLPALALGFEPAERDVMRRPPYSPGESVFARGLGRDVVWVGLLMSMLALGAGAWYWQHGRLEWQTMLFTTLTLSQLANVLAVRSERDSLFTIGLWSNWRLVTAVLVTVLLQLGLLYVPALQAIFGTVALPAGDLALTLLLSSSIFWVVEAQKWLLRNRTGHAVQAGAH
jgi:Ca2+-transporting ATPase